jgi:hypothetical protein
VVAEIEFPRKSLQRSLNATGIMVEEADIIDTFVQVEIEPNSIILSSERSKGMATGWTKSRIETEYEGTSVHFKINPMFLYQILDRMTNFSIRTKKRALFTKDNFTHIIALTPED